MKSARLARASRLISQPQSQIKHAVLPRTIESYRERLRQTFYTQAVTPNIQSSQRVSEGVTVLALAKIPLYVAQTLVRKSKYLRSIGIGSEGLNVLVIVGKVSVRGGATLTFDLTEFWEARVD